jgi:DNA-binding GntR family transcriptional regulator
MLTVLLLLKSRGFEMPLPEDSPEYRDLAQWVVLKIIEAVRSGVIKSGERLVERQVAERFSVSRAPVRDAIHTLEKLGVVERSLPRGVFVRSWTEQDATEILHLIDALILLSAKLAAGRLSKADVRALEAILKRTKKNMFKKPFDPGEQLALDAQFHAIIAEATGNRRLVELLASLALPVELWPETFHGRVVPKYSFRQHRELLNVLCNGDAAEAVACVIRHQEERQ